MHVGVDAAGGQDQMLARDRVGGRRRLPGRGSTPSMRRGLPALPIADDPPVLDADVGLDDAEHRRR